MSPRQRKRHELKTIVETVPGPIDPADLERFYDVLFELAMRKLREIEPLVETRKEDSSQVDSAVDIGESSS